MSGVERERLTVYDTTLRDGQQTHGVQFSLEDKLAITAALDGLGVDYIEAGWPGANPTDSAYFEAIPNVRHAKIAAFGMTKRTGRSAANDEILAQMINCNADTVCIVGKTCDFHVKTALGISLEDNLENIAQSITHLTEKGREAIFDAEHFFDGFRASPEYSLECLQAAYSRGARWVVLCDTNGGTLPSEIARITERVIESGIHGKNLGIHTHNDTGTAVAGTLAAVDAGARQIQGTLNGIGERCGNANLVSMLPTLMLKEPYASRFSTGIDEHGLQSLTRVSRLLDDILNRVPEKSAPYVGASAFVHKAGLHASAVIRDPTTYEHVNPKSVGNQRFIPMSNQAGRSNLTIRLREAGISIEPKDFRIGEIVQEVKRREDAGYSFDIAQASFELLARRMLGILPEYFSVEEFSVTVKHSHDFGEMRTSSFAKVSLRVAGDLRHSTGSSGTRGGADYGPVNALAAAVNSDLGQYQSYVDDMKLVDFKVSILNGGTEAVTRVIIDSEDKGGRRWSTIGVSANIIDASFEALTDAIRWKLVRDQAPEP